MGTADRMVWTGNGMPLRRSGVRHQLGGRCHALTVMSITGCVTEKTVQSRLNGMNTNLASAPNQNQNVRTQSSVARAYWASVTRCVARSDDSNGIVHADGRVERFDVEGSPIRTRREGIAHASLRHDKDADRHALAV